MSFNLIEVTLFCRYSNLIFYWTLLLIYREMGYDGIVLESWSRWAAYGILHDADMRALVNTNFLIFIFISIICLLISLNLSF